MTTTATSTLIKTKNSLPEDVRERMAGLLNARLADCIDLATQAKQAHWNVKGPRFHGLHELFDEITGEVREHADLIAERAVMLGATARGTARDAAAGSTLGEYPHDIHAGLAHADAFSTALASFGSRLREAIEAAGEAGDAATEDLFTEVLRSVDKYTWMVEAYVQEAE